jgi:hypothetical protein
MKGIRALKDYRAVHVDKQPSPRLYLEAKNAKSTDLVTGSA